MLHVAHSCFPTTSVPSVAHFGCRLECLNSYIWKTLSVHRLLTVSAASPPLKNEAIWHRAISTQRRQFPVADGDGRDASGQDQQVVAQVQGGGAAFQLGTWLDTDTEPVDWRRDREARREEAWKLLIRKHIHPTTNEVEHKNTPAGHITHTNTWTHVRSVTDACGNDD